ncbi:helix-turn-helix transcriptional regulator [Alteromonas sp. a30]|uniref:helix-turn-helix transcriptional regulator n=1 Tax=Alteromonas sp. a30 TaxID=2730917 RepID=UPI00227E7E93|nr:helix-turn-helix domain-containing protein [Alteromonas sp. a30]MCY7294275.1 helix-turn-helix domain-containing protein [Alteromonas sp. a30]
MNQVTIAFQIFLIAIGCAWIFPLVLTWVRYDRLPHARYAFIFILSAPLMLLDNVLVVFNWHVPFSYLLGLFDFIPVLLIVLSFLSVQKMLLERPEKPSRHLWVVVFFALLQFPFLLMNPEAKVLINVSPVVGEFKIFWFVYLYQLLVAIVVLAYAAFILLDLNAYKNHLPEHTADTGFYKVKSLTVMHAMMLAVSATAIVTVLLVALDLSYIAVWQFGLVMLYSFSLWLVAMVLVEKRLYAPSPINYFSLHHKQLNEQDMQLILDKADAAIVENKIYRKKGIRLRQLCDLSGIEPTEFAIACREIQGKTFRDFIFHYRLEYAKLLLSQTDTKVSVVARKLGFDSEKSLSEMFERYVEKLTKEHDASKEG